MWFRIVRARRSASTTAVTISPTATRPRRTPRWTIEPGRLRPGDALRVHDVEQDAAIGVAAAERPDVRDLPAALGVERRPIEDDLGRGGRRLAELRLGHCLEGLVLETVAQDRDDRGIGGRRVVAEERRRASAGEERAVALGGLGGPGELGLPPGAAAVALLGQGHVEPGTVDADTVFGGQLDGEVDREAERVVEPERDVAGQDRGVDRQVVAGGGR